MSVRYAAVLFVAVATLVLSPAVLAEHDPDWQGWILELEGAYVQPAGDDTEIFARTVAPRSIGFPFPGQNEITELEWDQTIIPSAAVGYSFGRSGAVRVSFWNYTDSTEIKGASDSFYYGIIQAYNWWTIGPIDTFATVFDNAHRFDFDVEMEAKTLDLEYLRTTGMGKPLTVTFGFGIRLAEFDETIKGEYTVDRDDDPNIQNLFRFPAKRDVGNEAWGITASIGAMYDFNQVIGLRTNVRLGFLVTDIDASHQIQDADDFNNLTITGVFEELVEEDDESGTSIEFEFGIRTHIAGYFDLDIGWDYTSFRGLPAVDLHRASNAQATPAVSNGPATITRDEITFMGPTIKMLFFF